MSAVCFGQGEIKEDVTCIYFKSKSKLAGELCDAFKKLKEFYDYEEYAEGFADDFKNGKEPRKPPTKLVGGGTMIERLTNVEKEILAIVIPSEIKSQTQYPSLENLSSNDFGERRAAVNLAVNSVIEANELLTDYEIFKGDLESFKKEADAVNSALNILKKELWETFQNTGGGYTELSNIFGFEALELETKLHPKVAHIRNALNNKLKEITKLLNKEQTSIGNLQNNTKLIVIAESEALNIRKNELDSVQQKLIEEGDEFQERAEKNDEKGGNLKKVEDELIEQQKDLQRIQKDLQKQIDSYNSDVRRLSQKERSINKMKYTGCPNGKSFNNCDHTNQKNSYVKKRNVAVKSYNDLARRTESKAKSINSRQGDFKNKFDSWNSRYSKFEEDAIKWQKENENLIAEQNNLIERTRDYFMQNWDIGGKIEENNLDLERIENMQNINPN
ncbi:hypothetical protein GCM10009122_15940 [Fulvivirga kasyanovii]